jgi:hypothetical protein
MLSMLLFTGSVFIDKAEGCGDKLRDPVRVDVVQEVQRSGLLASQSFQMTCNVWRIPIQI